MRLMSPLWLLLLLPVTLVAAGYIWQLRRRSRYAVRFAALPMLARLVPNRPGWRRHLPASLLLVTFGLLSVAAARPEVDIPVPRENATVVVVVDVSLSMAARDVEPTRIEAASESASEFVEDLPDDVNVGIVTFSGTTAVLSQPTTDHARAASTLDDLTLESRTAIGEGLFTSLRMLQAQERLTGADVPAHVVLLSDGQNTFGRSPDQAADAARRADVPVSTIAYGSGQSAGPSSSTLGETGAATLGLVAERTGGEAYTAETSDELRSVYDDISSSVGWRTEATEVSPYLSAIALVCGLAAAALSLRWFVRLP